MDLDPSLIARTLDHARAALLERLVDGQRWDGRLSSSALSTATAIIAFDEVARHLSSSGDAARLTGPIRRGLAWLVDHQNGDGGWGDTPASLSNISTTALCWAALAPHEETPSYQNAARVAEAWLTRTAGSLTPDAIALAIRRRYGRDRTFSAPILTVCALAGRLGPDGWRLVPQLPFELALLPPRVFGWARLPVVSYALPALIAIGQLRHRVRPTRNPIAGFLRDRAGPRTLDLLTTLQPSNGGFLEAIPLTSFVVASLAAAGRADHPVTRRGLEFLISSIREDGSWPIDTNLATWMTTLSVHALAAGGAGMSGLDADARQAILDWLLARQHRDRHPYTQAAPGGWAWTDRPGGVPDADDTAGALLALRHLALPDCDSGNGVRSPLPPAPAAAATSESASRGAAARGGGAPRAVKNDERARVRESSDVLDAARAGVDWLLQLQNRDGGMPTFCRGWGYLPFDRSGPDLTAHALRAWTAWRTRCPERSPAIDRAVRRAVGYLARSQRSDGSWVPLWFGSESAPGEENPTYGTTRVIVALSEVRGGAVELAPDMRDRAVEWLLGAQQPDGGWGGAPGVAASVEETAQAVEALSAVTPLRRFDLAQPRPDRVERRQDSASPGSRPGATSPDQNRIRTALGRGVEWLVRRTDEGRRFPASPIGLYFARLWYYEELYPLIFTIAAFERASSSLMEDRRCV